MPDDVDPADPADPDLTPEQSREVTRLIADARHDEPIPTDVADRLDRVLADLGRDRSSPGAEVISLAAHRRRRVLLGLVAAAAVITVAGVGARSLSLGHGSDSATSADAAATGAAPADSPTDATGTKSVPQAQLTAAPSATVGETASGTTAPVPGSSVGGAGGADAAVPQLHATTWTQDVEDLLASGVVSDYAAPSSVNGAGTTGEPALRLPAACKPADFGPGTLLVVEYDGTPAVLAIRPPSGQSEVVELLQCGTATVVRTVTLPA